VAVVSCQNCGLSLIWMNDERRSKLTVYVVYRRESNLMIVFWKINQWAHFSHTIYNYSWVYYCLFFCLYGNIFYCVLLIVMTIIIRTKLSTNFKAPTFAARLVYVVVPISFIHIPKGARRAKKHSFSHSNQSSNYGINYFSEYTLFRVIIIRAVVANMCE
jgi:hypothetical protein